MCVKLNIIYFDFAHFVSQKLFNKQIAPPFKPVLSAADDSRYFDPEFTRMLPLG